MAFEFQAPAHKARLRGHAGRKRECHRQNGKGQGLDGKQRRGQVGRISVISEYAPLAAAADRFQSIGGSLSDGGRRDHWTLSRWSTEIYRFASPVSCTHIPVAAATQSTTCCKQGSCIGSVGRWPRQPAAQANAHCSITPKARAVGFTMRRYLFLTFTVACTGPWRWISVV